jgi:hypothetical protein
MTKLTYSPAPFTKDDAPLLTLRPLGSRNRSFRRYRARVTEAPKCNRAALYSRSSASDLAYSIAEITSRMRASKERRRLGPQGPIRNVSPEFVDISSLSGSGKNRISPSALYGMVRALPSQPLSRQQIE